MPQTQSTLADTARRRPATDATTVAVVSPSASERDRLAKLFVEAGFTVLQAESPEAAQTLIGPAGVDLVLLQCPAMVGDELAFCRNLASTPFAPLVLVLASRADVVDEIIALEVGADDLLVGPVADRLVLAHAKALLRRAAPRVRMDSPERDEADSGWRLNPTTRAAISPGGRSVLLAPADASAFHLFLTNPGVVFTGEAGARAIGAGAVSPAAFRTTVCRLRKKLDGLGDGRPIQTVRGIGYAYAPAVGRVRATELAA